MEDRYESFLTLRLAGKSYAEIAFGTGVSRQRVQQILSPYPEVKDIVIARTGGRCEACSVPAGATGHIHHRTAKGALPEFYNVAENLTLLCNRCHRIAHGNPATRDRRRPRTAAERVVGLQNRGLAIGASALGISITEYKAHRDAGERWCSGHQQWEPESGFSEMMVRGKLRVASRCVKANRELSRAHARRVTQEGRQQQQRSPASLRQGATRLGIPVESYVAQIEAGQKWCGRHKHWQPRSDFGSNVRAHDGLNFYCREADREYRANRNGAA